MLDFAKLPVSERNPYFDEVADRRNLTRRIVEKDFWVCFTLRLLFSDAALAHKFVFKGGTSLSKVFGVIKRFSEDVDLSVDPTWLGFGGENRPDAATSRSQFEKRWKKMNEACAAAVDGTVRPALESAIRSAIGPAPHGKPYLDFILDAQSHSPVINFRYPTDETDTSGYVHPQVKLELGSLTDQRPIGEHTVTPWVAEELPSLFTASTCRVVALEIERTFWEKATILHIEYQRTPDKPMRSRLSRDCYDLCKIAAHPAGQRAMQDLDLLAHVVKHKRIYFQSSWANYDTAVPGSIRLVPPDSRLAAMRTDYQQMQVMFTEPPPSFDEILQRLRDIQLAINAGHPPALAQDSHYKGAPPQ